MKCPFCTQDIESGMKFCPHCGKPVPQNSVIENTEGSLSESAAKDPLQGSNVTPADATAGSNAIAEAQSVPPQQPPGGVASPLGVDGKDAHAKKKRRKIILIILAIVLLLIGAALVYLFLLNPKAEVTQTVKTIEAGTEVDPLTLIAVKEPEDFTVAVKSSDLDTKKTGTYKIVYTVTAKEHGKGNDYEFTFTVQDTIPPQITGESTFTVLKGEQLDVRSAMVITDNLDGIIDAATATVTGTPDFTKAGTYPLTLSISDKAGNKATKEVTVIVEDKSNPAAFFNQIHHNWEYVLHPETMVSIRKVDNQYIMYIGYKEAEGHGGPFVFKSITPDNKVATLTWQYSDTIQREVRIDLGVPGDGKMKIIFDGGEWQDLVLYDGN